MRTGTICVMCGAGLCVSAFGQGPDLGAAGSIVRAMRASESGGRSNVRAPIVASLSYDGEETSGFAAQDFESVFDDYDTFCCEIFSIDEDANLTEVRTTGFGNGNPFGLTDFVAEIYLISDLEDLCDDGDLPEPILRTVPGVGFYDGVDAVSNFEGACLPSGEYILRWAAVMDFSTFGQFFVFGQRGEHDHGGGEAADGFQSNPGNAFGMGFCFDTSGGGKPIEPFLGMNFVLCGDEASCDAPCADPNACGDWDSDGDSDGDDLFAYLDAFTRDDPCADLDGNGTVDGDDFFGFLDRFVAPC